jgi:metallophosphoesterase (TIGR03767 family)
VSHAAASPGVGTVERAVRRGAPGEGGWAELEIGPGDPHVGAAPSQGDVLGCLLHLSDVHVCDAESTARQEYLDHHGDPGAPYAARLGEIGTYRPQEILTVPVLAATLVSVQRTAHGPLTGAEPDAVLLTGDVTDNAQRNELTWYVDLMTGRGAAARSGGADSSWVGAPGAGGWWPWFWHPEEAPRASGTASAAVDLPRRRFGYPAVPGLVEAARAAVPSPGAGLPWLTVHGNHDALLQGTVAPTPELSALAVGDRRVVDLAPGQTPLVALEGAAPQGPARYTHDAGSPTVAVPADPTRALVAPDDFAAAVRAAGGMPETPPGARYWACDVGRLRVVALDTVNPHGGWQGSVDAEQLAWLEAELVRSRDRYVVVTSHHPSWTLVNGYAPPGAAPRHLADDVLGLLLAHRCVVAWLSGHVHRHTTQWHQAPDRAGGLWEVTTASLVDWPQQWRVVEVVRERGTVALACTAMDHAAPVAWDAARLEDPLVLAALSRTLAANDYRARRPGVLEHLAGAPEDRNVVLRLADPFG